MKIKEIVNTLERFAPPPLQDGFDNASLQTGLAEAETAGALLCLDVTEAVLDEAIALGYNLVISHHPLIFKSYRSITNKDYVKHCILKTIKNDIVAYSAHTNLNNVRGGVNCKIAEKIGLKNPKVLEPKENGLIKLVTFAPDAQADSIRETLFAAGRGNMGSCNTCSYNLKGERTFRVKERTHPFCGTISGLHHENEARIETILPIYKKAGAMKTLLSVRPYEEPAFDLYPLQNDWSQAGSGIVGELDKSGTELEFLKRIEKIFEVGCVHHNKLAGREIQKVALCGDAGASLLPQAIRTDADVFITGEIEYHDYFGHKNGILMAKIGHYESEQHTKEIFYSIVRDLFPNFALQLSKIDTNPIRYL